MEESRKDIINTIKLLGYKKMRKDTHNIENLIFEGGGVKSVAYGGALTAMGDLGLLSKVKRVGGTSAGAITACLLAIGYTPKEIAKIIVATDFSDFQDDSFGVIRDTYRLVTKYGWHKGGSFIDWIGKYVEEKLGNKDATFRDLAIRASNRIFGCSDLYVVVTNLTKQRAEVYSAETTPDKSIVEAVRISMSIPIFFQCMRNDLGDILVDGGVADNFPIRIFDKYKYVRPPSDLEKYVVNPNTIGFRLDTKAEIEANKTWGNTDIKINNIKDYIEAIITYLMEVANKRHLKECDRERTIFINIENVKATDFNLSKKKIETLKKNGQEAVYKYFKSNAWRSSDVYLYL